MAHVGQWRRESPHLPDILIRSIGAKDFGVRRYGFGAIECEFRRNIVECSTNRATQSVCICLDSKVANLQEGQVETRMSHIILESDSGTNHSTVAALEAEVRAARTALDECIRKGAAAIQAIRADDDDCIQD